MDSPDWQRVHRATLIFEFLQAIQQIFVGLLLLRLGVPGANMFDGAGLGQVMEYVVVIGALAAAVVRWYSTRYWVGAEAVRYEYGLIRRRKQVMPRHRIQNVSTSTSLLGRVFGLAKLQISDASGGDITMKYIASAEAERLAATLRSTSTASGPPAPLPADQAGPVLDGAEPAATGGADPLVSPPFGEVVIARGLVALTEFTVLMPYLALAGLVAWRRGLLGNLGAGLGGAIDRRFGLVLLFFVGPIAVKMVTDLLALGNFRLWADGDRFRIRSGLLSEQQIATRRARIQAVEVGRGYWLRRSGRERVRFATADQDLLGGEVTRFLSPSQTLGSWALLAEAAFGAVSLGEADLKQVSPLTLRRALIRGLVITAVVSGAIALFDPILAVAVLVAGATIAVWLSVRRYESIGYALDDQHLLVRVNVVGQRLTLVNLDKVQKIESHQSWFQRRLELVSVSVIVAGQGTAAVATIPDLERNEAADLIGLLTKRSARTPFDLTL